MRILEIGAGTGGTRSRVLPVLPATATYHFTDVSPLFLERAADLFSGFPFVEFRRLDIEQEPVGQGFDAASYDIIIAAKSANCVFTFANLGLTPDVGGTWLVARAAGRVRALEMALLTGKMSAEKAERCNLVTEVVDDAMLMERAREVAVKLAAMPTKSLALIKSLVRAALESSFEASLQAEAESQQAAAATEDFKEGVRAFAERRSPQFKGR